MLRPKLHQQRKKKYRKAKTNCLHSRRVVESRVLKEGGGKAKTFALMPFQTLSFTY